MYAGFVSSKHSVAFLGTHQKFNRAAYSVITEVVADQLIDVEARGELARFPSIKSIQSFEGVHGPDGLKVKAPGKEEPWHFLDPFDESDVKIFEYIDDHYNNLVKALREKNEEKAAFEASWLSHVIVDGLTPAHHYPYEHELHKIRGEDKETRNSKTKKLLVKGENVRDTAKKNWMMLGAKGLLTTHVWFEAGVTGAVLTHRIKGARPSDIELEFVRNNGLHKTLRHNAQQVARMNIYGKFMDWGMTPLLARRIRYKLAPIIVKTIALFWITALEESRTK